MLAHPFFYELRFSLSTEYTSPCFQFYTSTWEWNTAWLPALSPVSLPHSCQCTGYFSSESFSILICTPYHCCILAVASSSVSLSNTSLFFVQAVSATSSMILLMYILSILAGKNCTFFSAVAAFYFFSCWFSLYG